MLSNADTILTTHSGNLKAASAEDWITEGDIPDPKNVEVLNEYLMIRPLGLGKGGKTKGGLILPDIVLDHNSQLVTVGRVIGIGEYAGKRANVSRPSIGDYVIYPKHGGALMTVQKVKVVIIPDDAIFAKVQKEDVLGE